jgi:hypothetical protein
MFATHPGNLLSLYAAKISYIASAVRFSICVNDLAVETRLENAEAGNCIAPWALRSPKTQ